MPLAAIALGSNLDGPFGEPADNVDEALQRLSMLGSITAVSSFYRTAPVGYLDQPDFLNAAALLATQLPPLALLRALLRIEAAMGRNRRAVPLKGPRIIDLDLLLYDSHVSVADDLTLPHPAMHQREFVLAPLAEIAPDWLHPKLHRTVRALLDALPEKKRFG